jgi:hypothetical protein
MSASGLQEPSKYAQASWRPGESVNFTWSRARPLFAFRFVSFGQLICDGNTRCYSRAV